MHANVLKIHIWIPHEKIDDPYFTNIYHHVLPLKETDLESMWTTLSTPRVCTVALETVHTY